MQPDHDEITQPPRWRDRRKYLRIIGTGVPLNVFIAWAGALATGIPVFWWVGPIVAFLLIPLLDAFAEADVDNPPESVEASLENDRFYRWAVYLYLPAQYCSLIFACWLWAGGGWVRMTFVDKLGLMATVGIIGGIAINAAHELGHKRQAAEKRLSKLALAQTCYGHFFVEHNRGHHARVATPDDPASSRLGESLYPFIVRSVIGSARSAWNIERRRFAAVRQSHWSLKNDVLNAWAMSTVLFIVLAVWFRPVVLPWLAGQAIVGFCMLETVNYLEHYGLRRRSLADGRYERVRARHSWNSTAAFSNIFLFHLQRHSDHHVRPQRRYQALHHSDEAPQLPSGYAGMMLLAMCPPLWHRVMDPRVLDHYNGDIRLAAVSRRDEDRLLRRYPVESQRRAS